MTNKKTLARAHGEALRSLREKRKVSKYSLAEKIGMDSSYIVKLERGDHEPKHSTVLRIVEALGYTYEDFARELRVSIRRIEVGAIVRPIRKPGAG